MTRVRGLRRHFREEPSGIVAQEMGVSTRLVSTPCPDPT
jgi:hypothetical protein